MTRPGVALAGLLVALWLPIAASARLRQVAQTSSTITAADLEHRLRIFAHDSLHGRALATRGLVSATQYIAAELRRLGLEPLGDGGSFTATVPLERWEVEIENARLGMRPPIAPRGFRPGVDFVPITFLRRSAGPNQVPYVVRYGGRFGGRQPVLPDSVLNFSAMVFLPELGDDGAPAYAFWESVDWLRRYDSANAIVVGGLEMMPRHARERLLAPRYVLAPPPSSSPAVAQRAALDSLPPVFLATTSAVQLFMRVADSVHIFRSYQSRASRPAGGSHNVIAMLRGRETQFPPEIVVLSASADGPGIAAPDDRIDGDSVINGANAGGSGAMALLEIAEYLVSSGERPRRSVMFVWTVGSEHGEPGAEWFVRNLTLAQRSGILANIAVGAIGRGADGSEAGDSLSVAVVGSRDAVPNLAGRLIDVAGWPEHGVRATTDLDTRPSGARLRCTGLHPQFTRLGVPSALITAGPHADYHTVHDDADHIDFPAYERLVRLVASVVLDLANNSTRPAHDAGRASVPVCPN